MTSEEPWVFADGTHWLYFPQYKEWHGWEPGEDGLWILTDDEFADFYQIQMAKAFPDLQPAAQELINETLKFSEHLE